MAEKDWTQARHEDRAERRRLRLEAAEEAKAEIERLEAVEARALAAQQAAKVRRREIECARLAAREKRRRDEGPLAEDGSDDDVVPGVEEEPYFRVQKLGIGYRVRLDLDENLEEMRDVDGPGGGALAFADLGFNFGNKEK